MFNVKWLYIFIFIWVGGINFSLWVVYRFWEGDLTIAEGGKGDFSGENVLIYITGYYPIMFCPYRARIDFRIIYATDI
jgi:hypothetical protein